MSAIGQEVEGSLRIACDAQCGYGLYRARLSSFAVAELSDRAADGRNRTSAPPAATISRRAIPARRAKSGKPISPTNSTQIH
jgi:hypothetical protein